MIVNVLKLKKDNPNQPLCYTLTTVFGIGLSTAQAACAAKGIHKLSICKDISDKKARQIATFVNDNLLVDMYLGSFLKKKKDKHINSQTYKGTRYEMALPVNGQRTHSNASLGKKHRPSTNKVKASRRDFALKYKKRAQFFPKI